MYTRMPKKITVRERHSAVSSKDSRLRFTQNTKTEPSSRHSAKIISIFAPPLKGYHAA